MLVIGIVMMGSTGLYFKKTYDPGPVSAAGSPGRMVGGYESHAAFEKECLHCHVPIHCLSANRCQTCHMDIARERSGGEGLHGLMPGTGKCQTCHTEHKGRDARITSFPLVNIDHEDLTGFSLARHEEDGMRWPCNRCHGEGQFVAAMVDCVGCHSDSPQKAAFLRAHIETFGDECTACHDGRDTMTSSGHKEIYAPNGPHSNLTCDACHEGRPSAAGVEGACTACHPEPAVHAGEFGQDCSRCHTTAAWSPAQIRRHPFRLDHGGAGTLECQSCHEHRYTEYTCSGCHEPEQLPAGHPAETTPTGCVTCHPTGQKGEGEEHRTHRAGADDAPALRSADDDGGTPAPSPDKPSKGQESRGEDGNKPEQTPTYDPGQMEENDGKSDP